MSSELSAKQTQAALLLARGDTVTTTAEQVGVNGVPILTGRKRTLRNL